MVGAGPACQAGYFAKRTAEAWLHDILVEARRGTLPGMARSGVTFADRGGEWLRFIREDRERKVSTLLTDSRDGDDGAIEDGDEGAERLNVERVWGTNDRTTKAQTCVRIPASSVPIPPAIRGRRATPSRRHPAPPQAR